MKITDYSLLENLDEKYFSDILRLFLTTKGMERGFRTRFANEFVKKVYKNDKRNFALSNSSVFREYPLNITKRRTKNIDLLFFDLDENDDVVIGIENKFLGHDSKNQLNDYFTSLSELFPEQYERERVKIVYLTLDGRRPINNLGNVKKNDLVCLSWLEDIKEIVVRLSKEMNYDLNPQIQQFINIINLLKNIKDNCSIQVTYNVSALSTYICNILNETVTNKIWEITSDKEQNSYTIYRCHKNENKTQIKINVAFYGHYYALEYFKGQKFFIPINLNIEQAIHFIEIFCRRLLLSIKPKNNNNSDGYIDIKNINDPNDIKNIFCISKNEQEDMFKNALCKYFSNTKNIINEDS